jgi:WD40 repeat protein
VLGKLLYFEDDAPTFGDGQTVVVWDIRNYIRTVDVRSGARREIRQFPGFLGYAVPADGSAVVVVSDAPRTDSDGPKLVQVWDAATRQTRTLGTYDRSGGGMQSVAVTRDGTTIAAGTGAGGVRLWDLRSGESRALVENVSVLKLTFSPDGGMLAVTPTHRGTTKFYDVRKATARGDLPAGVERFRFASDGKSIVASFKDGRVARLPLP